MDTSNLVTLSADTTKRLEEIWENTGLDVSLREKTIESLSRQIQSVFQDILEKEKKAKQEIEKECEDCEKEIEVIIEKVKLQDEVKTFHNEPLLQRKELLKEELQKYREIQNEQLGHLQNALEKLHNFWKLMGIEIKKNFEKIDEDISNDRLNEIKAKIEASEKEIIQRKEVVSSFVSDICDLFNELCVEESSMEDFDVLISKNDFDAIGFHNETLRILEKKLEDLLEVKRKRQELVKDLAQKITALWIQLHISENERQEFLSKHSGLGEETIEACKHELNRLKVLKEASLKDLIQRARNKLVQLWDETMVGEEERKKFLPAFSDCFTDESHEAHEREITKLEEKAETMRPLLKLVSKRDSILEKKVEFDIFSKDPNRFKNGKGMIEETKFRVVLSKTLPKIEESLYKSIPKWEKEHGDFVINGERYIDTMNNYHEKIKSENEAKKNKKNIESTGALKTPQPSKRKKRTSKKIPATSRKPSKMDKSIFKNANSENENTSNENLNSHNVPFSKKLNFKTIDKNEKVKEKDSKKNDSFNFVSLANM